MFEDAKKNNRDRVTVRISKEIHKRFNDHILSVGYDKSRLVEKIIENYLNQLL